MISTGTLPVIQQNPMKGIVLIVIATLLFALGDSTTKHLTLLYSLPLIIGLRYLINLLILIVVLGPRHGYRLVHTERTGLVYLRAASLAISSLSMGYALRYMPLGETIAIIYLGPFVVMMLAIPLLGETVTRAGWIGAAVGFAGVLLIVRPGGGLDPTGVVFALITAAGSVIYHLLSRVLAKTETTLAMLFHTALLGTVVFGSMIPWSLDGRIPTLPDALLLLGLGVIATTGHFMFTAAYREAPASLLAPVNYIHLVWAGLFGWLFFGHVPGTVSIIGMALVAAAGVAVTIRSHFSGK